MIVGRLLILLGALAMSLTPGSIRAIQLVWNPMHDISSALWLACGGEPAATPRATLPSADRESGSNLSPHCTEQPDRETLQVALAAKPRHRLRKHGGNAAAPSNSSKLKPSRDAPLQSSDGGQPQPATPEQH